MAVDAAFWTAETYAKARALWVSGLTSGDVARAVGAPSADAVLGRMWRLGVTRAPIIAWFNQRLEASSRNRRRRISFAVVPGSKSPTGQRGPLLVFDHPPPPAPILCDPRPWITRDAGECAFPVAGDGETTLSCCNRAVHRGYCEAHRTMMVRPLTADRCQGPNQESPRMGGRSAQAESL